MSLSGRILRVDIEGFLVAVANLSVSKPHWPADGPTRPAAITAGSAARTTVRIALDQVSGLASTGVLTGRLGTLTIRGRCPLAAGEHEVTARLTGDPLGGFRRHDGAAVWSILPDGASTPLPLATTTPLEIFELLGDPPCFYSNRTGVWAEALRFLAERVGLTGVSDRTVAVGQIARFCYQRHGLRYDADDGGGSFLSAPHLGVFKLSRYLQGGTQDPVSCYDQAAAIQALAGALGIEVQYCYLQPLGHLQVVDLVGVGRCNNPFFQNPRHPPQPVVSGTPRSFFANHTFCRLDNRIHDACVGPHVGAHRADAYLARVIDTTVHHHPHGIPERIMVAGGILRCR